MRSGRPGTTPHSFNGIAGSVRAGDLDTLSSLPRVKRVHRDYQVHVNLGESVPLIGAPQIWDLEDEQGQSVTGHGIVVAIIDTGIDYTHPDLGGCFGPGCRVMGGYDFINDDSDPMDDMGHGTHVAGIVGASGVSTGVAPDVSFLAYKVLNESGFGSFSGIIEAIERATDDGADVINLSLGGPGDPDDPLSQAVDLGVTVAIAARNSGPGYSTVGSPGAARKPISVAATDKDDQIEWFSSRGPIPGEWNIKPDLAAPGVSILAPVPALGVLGDPSRYLHLSGTSMATPHVAGAAALLLQLHPEWTPDNVKSAMANTSLDLGYDPYTQGAGRIQLLPAANTSAVATP